MLVNSPIINDAVNAGIEVVITKEGLRIDGFYKSGSVMLTQDRDDPTTLVATARYNDVTYIYSFDDLVYLNYEWWDRSRGGYDGWRQPDSIWAEEMVRLGLIEKIIVPATVSYRAKRGAYLSGGAEV